MSAITGFLGFPSKGSEGQYRPGPYYLPYSGGWLSAEAGSYLNWWQMGYDVKGGGGTAMVEACISAYAQTVAMCPGNHWLLKNDGGRERVVNSALTRVLRRPNDYQSISDFLLNAVRWVYYEGNAYALAVRNERYEITQLHLMDSTQSQAQLAYNGEIFYDLGGNEIVERQIGPSLKVPARDVLHIKLHTPRHPLKGETPLMAAALQQAATNAALEQQLRFFANQARPAFVLTTDQVLTKEQVEVIRERWNEQAKGLNSGGTPILTAGLKADKLTVSAQDNAVIDLLKLSDGAIATVLRIPSALVNQGTAPFSSTEALMQFWLASGLGFILNHVEEAIGNLFRLKGQPDEYLEFDTGALLRTAYKDRVEAEARAVQGGLKSPNEARAELELPEVEFGDEPRVQQQVVPLSAWGKQLEAPTQPGGQPAAPADVPAKVDPSAAKDDADKEAEENKAALELAPALFQIEFRQQALPLCNLPASLLRFNEADHPRDPAGTSTGGQFTSGGGEGGGDQPADNTKPKGSPPELKQTSDDPETLFAEAEVANAYLATWLDKGDGVANQMGAETTTANPGTFDFEQPGHTLFLAPLKTRESAERKVRDEYHGDWSELRDLARTTVAVDTIEQAYAMADRIKATADVAKFKDRYGKDGATEAGYRDLAMIVRAPNGHLMEVQVNTKAMMQAKNVGHKDYEISRVVEGRHKKTPKADWPQEDRAAYDQAMDRQIAVYSAAYGKLKT
jgi:HK97 family phage portal protein